MGLFRPIVLVEACTAMDSVQPSGVVDVVDPARQPQQPQQTQLLRSLGALGPAPPQFAGLLWLIVVSAFVVFTLGSALAIYLLLASGKDPKDFIPLVTAVLGVLAGLLAPSPVVKQ